MIAPYFIVNPTAGGGKAKRRWQGLQETLLHEKFPYHVLYSHYSGHAEILAKQAVKEGARIVYAVGGDGTLQEVANGVHSTGVRLGGLPFGSVNEYLKNWNVAQDIEGIMAMLRQGCHRLVDLAMIQDRIFCNIAGVGFDGHVTALAEEKYKGWGSYPAYIFSALQTLTTYNSPLMRVEIDGRIFEQKAFLIAVGNGCFYGGGMKMLPEACPHDGLLDVCVIEDIGLAQILKILPTLYTGNHYHNPCVQYFKARNISIHTHPSVRAEADGEYLTWTPVHIRILPSAIEFIVPPA